MDLQLKAYDAKIVELREKLKMEKKETRDKYDKQMADLEAQNAKLTMRKNEYKEGTKEKWEDFKTSFNKDLAALGKSITELAEKNMKK